MPVSTRASRALKFGHRTTDSRSSVALHGVCGCGTGRCDAVRAGACQARPPKETPTAGALRVGRHDDTRRGIEVGTQLRLLFFGQRRSGLSRRLSPRTGRRCRDLGEHVAREQRGAGGGAAREQEEHDERSGAGRQAAKVAGKTVRHVGEGQRAGPASNEEQAEHGKVREETQHAERAQHEHGGPRQVHHEDQGDRRRRKHVAGECFQVPAEEQQRGQAQEVGGAQDGNRHTEQPAVSALVRLGTAERRVDVAEADVVGRRSQLVMDPGGCNRGPEAQEDKGKRRGERTTGHGHSMLTRPSPEAPAVPSVRALISAVMAAMEKRSGESAADADWQPAPTSNEAR